MRSAALHYYFFFALGAICEQSRAAQALALPPPSPSFSRYTSIAAQMPATAQALVALHRAKALTATAAATAAPSVCTVYVPAILTGCYYPDEFSEGSAGECRLYTFQYAVLGINLLKDVCAFAYAASWYGEAGWSQLRATRRPMFALIFVTVMASLAYVLVVASCLVIAIVLKPEQVLPVIILVVTPIGYVYQSFQALFQLQVADADGDGGATATPAVRRAMRRLCDRMREEFGLHTRDIIRVTLSGGALILCGAIWVLCTILLMSPQDGSLYNTLPAAVGTALAAWNQAQRQYTRMQKQHTQFSQSLKTRLDALGADHAKGHHLRA